MALKLKGREALRIDEGKHQKGDFPD